MTNTLKLINRVLIGLIIFFALIYLATIHLRPYPLSFLIKSLPIFLLSLLMFLNVAGNKGRLLSLGLIFSGIGDVLLTLHKDGSFVLGIAAFAIAHLFYISVFLRKIKLSGLRLSVVLALLVYSTAMGIILYMYAGTMFIPFSIYLMIILVMAISATLGQNNHFLVVIGACLFMISDSLIAISGFVLTLPLGSFWVMLTYYQAQGLIAYGTYLSVKNPAKP